MSRADTIHPRALLFFFRAYPSTPVNGSLRECFFFVPPSSLRPLLSRCFFLCLLGNLAVVIRPREILGVVKSARRGRRGEHEDTIPERDLDAIFKSGATSILSLFSPGLSRRVYAPPLLETFRGREAPVTVIRH